MLDIEKARYLNARHKKSILSINLQSYNKNHTQLKDLIVDLEFPKVVCVQETWSPKLNTCIPKYHPPLELYRTSKRGGGICIYVKQNLNYQPYEPINNIKSTAIEKQAVIITDSYTAPFIVINVYRPPNSNIRDSIKELSELLELAYHSGAPFIMVGDMNINVLRKDNNSNNYLEMLQTYECTQMVKEATRCTSKNLGSLIDHVIVNPKIKKVQSYVLDCEIADHLATLTMWQEMKDRDALDIDIVTKINYGKLKSIMKSHTFPELEDVDSEIAFNTIHEKVISAVEQSKYKVSRKNTPRNPWISDLTIKMTRDVDRLRKKFLKNNSTLNEYNYRKAKKELRHSISENKKSYYKCKLDQYQKNSYMTWKIINELLCRDNKKSSTKRKETIVHNGKTYETNKDIAMIFNSFYKNIAIDIAKDLETPCRQNKDYLEMSKQPEEVFEFCEVTEEEVKKSVMSLSNKSSTGPDGISNKILKEIIPFILKELTICINKSFLSEKFPTKLKISKISPIFKKEDRTNPANWRPIAQLSPFSKIFEQIIMLQVTEFFTRHEVITPKQFGFRQAHSTFHPLICVKNYIETKLQKKEHIILISLDLMKAFDCVKTNGQLQQKIDYYTKSSILTNWIDSYYRERSQFTVWEGENSTTLKNHDISIVQGSSMGPKMFNIYVNDLPNITNCYTVLFADDSNFLISHKDPEILNRMVNEELNTIADYFNYNGLSASISKTTYLYFCPKNKKRHSFNIKIGNKELQESQDITFLGVIIDNKMSFKKHYLKVFNKAKKGLNGLIMIKNKLNFRAKLNIYHSLIHSHFIYCALVWMSSITKKQLNSLKVVQKKALRIVYNKRFNAHTGKLFETSKITQVQNIFDRESCLLTFKYQNRNLPTEILNLYKISLNYSSIETRSMSATILRPNKELKKGNVMFDIITTWNNLGHNIRDLRYYSDFKEKITNIYNRYTECEKTNCYSCLNS